jgi:uncharacterized protein YggE
MNAPLEATAHTVTVTGRAVVAAAPDVARIRFACQASGPDVQAAISASSDAVVAARAALASAGVEGKDAPSGRVSVTAQEVWDDKSPRITGYSAEHQVTATVRDIDGVGEVLASVVAAAGNAMRLYGVDFGVDDEEAVRATARDRAFADAQAVASQYAAAAGRSLGAVTTIEEAEPHSGGPMPKARAMAMAAVAPVPVEPGTADITAAVRVTWQLV